MNHNSTRTVRKKYRIESQNAALPANLMSDPRIARGAVCVGGPRSQPSNDPKKCARKKIMPRSKPKTTLLNLIEQTQVVKKRVEIPLHKYLIEEDSSIQHTDASTQGDLFAERPPTPPFIPPKSGLDVSTQIETAEVFDFDRDVVPILTVLVGKVIEQSMMEVQEEQETAILARYKGELISKYEQDIQATKQMENLERQLRDEKIVPIKRDQLKAKEELRVAEKCFAMEVSKQYLSGCLSDSMNRLSMSGFFRDQQFEEVSSLLPWLAKKTVSKMTTTNLGISLVDDVIRQSCEKCKKIQSRVEEERQARIQKELELEQRMIEEKQEKERIIRVFIKGDGIGDTNELVGPLIFHPSIKISDVELQVHEWITKNVSDPPETLQDMKFFLNNTMLSADQTLSDVSVEMLDKLELRMQQSSDIADSLVETEEDQLEDQLED